MTQQEALERRKRHAHELYRQAHYLERSCVEMQREAKTPRMFTAKEKAILLSASKLIGKAGSIARLVGQRLDGVR